VDESRDHSEFHFEDVIPLHEVAACTPLTHEAASEHECAEAILDPFRSGLVGIFCAHGGCNAGRRYCLQVTQPLDLRSRLSRWKACGVALHLPPVPKGSTSGNTAQNVTDLAAIISQLAAAALKRVKPPSLHQRARAVSRRVFRSIRFQIFIAILLVLNFVANAYETQMYGKLRLADGSKTDTLIFLESADIFFTFIFTAELLINMYAHLVAEFVTDGASPCACARACSSWRAAGDACSWCGGGRGGAGWSLFDTFVVVVSLITLFSTADTTLPITVFRLLRCFRVLRIFGRS